MARFGRTINASWVLVAAIFLVGPLGGVLLAVKVGMSVVAAIVGGFLPLTIAAFVLHREARPRLPCSPPDPPADLLARVPVLIAGRVVRSDKLSVRICSGPHPGGVHPRARAVHPDHRLAAGRRRGGPHGAGDDRLWDRPAELSGPGLAVRREPDRESWALFIGAIVIMFAPLPRGLKLLLIPLVVYAGILPVSRGPAIGFILGICAGGAEKLRTFDRHDRRIQLAWAGIVIVAALGIVAGFGLFDRVSSVLTKLPRRAGRHLARLLHR